MFHKIPEDRSGMTAADLRALAVDVRKAALAALRSGAEKDDVAAARLSAAAIEDEAAEVDKIETAAADEAAREATRLAEAPKPEPVDEPVEPDEPEAPAEPEADSEAAVRSTALAVVQTGTTVTTEAEADTPRRLSPDLIMSVDDNGKVKAGQAFAGWGEFGIAALQTARSIDPTTDKRYVVGQINGRYDEAHTLTDSAFDNLRKLDTLGQYDGSVDEITASLCAPATPYYNLACLNSTARPVAASLPGFAAPRGKVTIYPSPSLSSVAGSAGIWTAADDANLSATKNACARIACATSTEFAMYGVYWCLTVKNMELLTFPELVAAYMNRGAANYARLGEKQLLDAMGAGLATVNTTALGYGATTRISTQLLNYLALYREMQRWDDVPMHMWAPRWLQVALQMDLSRRRAVDGNRRLATVAEVNQHFADAGFNVTWYLDTPTWGTAPGNLTNNPNLSGGVAATLNALPASVTVLAAPEGKFTMIDRAQVQIGVTGNNWYRDNASNAKNEVTYFFENYEGVVDTTSCPAHLINFQGLCYNGIQIADDALNCLGVEA